MNDGRCAGRWVGAWALLGVAALGCKSHPLAKMDAGPGPDLQVVVERDAGRDLQVVVYPDAAPVYPDAAPVYPDAAPDLVVARDQAIDRGVDRPAVGVDAGPDGAPRRTIYVDEVLGPGDIDILFMVDN